MLKKLYKICRLQIPVCLENHQQSQQNEIVAMLFQMILSIQQSNKQQKVDDVKQIYMLNDSIITFIE